MNEEQMVKIELVGSAWQEWDDFKGVKFITISKLNLNEITQVFTFKGDKWKYFLDYHDPFSVVITEVGSEKPEPKPRPEWISFKTFPGFDAVISVKHIRSMVMMKNHAFIIDSESNLEEDSFKITHETYEQIKKQLMGEV
jgi:hypothetical protein